MKVRFLSRDGQKDLVAVLVGGKHDSGKIGF